MTEIGQGDPTALGEDGDTSRSGGKALQADEWTTKPVFHVDDADTVGAYKTDSPFSGVFQHLGLQRLSLLGEFPEPAGFDDQPFDPFLSALIDDIGHGFRRREDDAHIDTFGEFLHRCQDPVSQQNTSMAPYQEDFTVKAEVEEVFSYDLSKIGLTF